MRKFFGRVISLTLSLLIIMSCGLGASAQEGYTYDFEVNSESLFMFSLDSGTVVYSMNADEERPMASLTKIMTYIVAYENIPDVENTVITVDPRVETELIGTGSSLAGIYVGEELTVLQMLNMMMIPSGNDAALALQIYYDDFVAEQPEDKAEPAEGEELPPIDYEKSPFIELMNKKARELGCTNTHFMNPHGLHHEEHYSTARDLAKITEYATGLPYFMEITGSRAYTLPATNVYDEPREITSTNRMLSQYIDDGAYFYTYANGIKTGSLNESGYCIAASATYEGYTYIVIAMGSPMIDEDGNYISYHGEMVDARTLFRWAFTQLSFKNIYLEGDLIADVDLQYAWDKDRLQVVTAKNVSAILPEDVSVNSIVTDVDLPESVQAPVKKGDVIGKATLSYANEVIAEVDLVAAESVQRSEIVQTIETSKEVVTSPWFLFIAAAIIVVLVVYIITIIIYNRRKKRMRRVRKYRNL